MLKFKDLFVPPLTVDRFNSARKELKRNGMLSNIEDIKRFVWKLSDTQIKVMFEFFTSSQVIQNVAWGTIKGRISEWMSCEKSVIFFFYKSCKCLCSRGQECGREDCHSHQLFNIWFLWHKVLVIQLWWWYLHLIQNDKALKLGCLFFSYLGNKNEDL